MMDAQSTINDKHMYKWLLVHDTCELPIISLWKPRGQYVGGTIIGLSVLINDFVVSPEYFDTEVRDNGTKNEE